MTKKKPTFETACPDIHFSNTFKNYVLELLDQIEDIRKRKVFVYLNFVLFGIIGSTIIVVNYSQLIKRFIQAFVREFDCTNWNYFVLILLTNLIGVLLIFVGFWPLNKHRKELKKLESDKRGINTVLKNYSTDIETLTNKNTH